MFPIISRKVVKKGVLRSFAMIATDAEKSLRDSISQFASSAIRPRVAEMDAKAKMDPALVQSLFQQV